MKKTFFGALALLCLMAAPVTFCSCGDDDDDDDDKTAAPATVTADLIVGTYSGKMTYVGYTDAPATAYAEVTRMSASSVKVKLTCSEYGLTNMEEIIMTVTPSGTGQADLIPESSISIRGNYANGVITFTFSTKANYTFYFSGQR